MRLRRLYALYPLVALAALAPAAVHAQASITVTVTARWGAPTPGTWNAYEVVIENGGDEDFQGTVVLVPASPSFSQGYSPGDQYPHYSRSVSVGHQATQKLEMMVYDAPFGYSVEVDDASGRKVADANVASSNQQAGYTVGVLSELKGADIAIQGAEVLNSRVIATQFPSASDFPKSALDLTGLQALVVDEFDSGSLSQAQVHALRDFVGLGGDLVIAGGSSWRRTLLALPPQVLPLQPSETRDVSLQPLADLAGLKTDQTASMVTGRLTGNPVLQGADGVPLVVESTYGAGRITLLTYDPLEDPIASNRDLSELGWSQGLARSLGNGALPIQGAVGKGIPVPVNGGGPVTASGRFALNGSYADTFSALLSQTPGASAPPLLLIGIALLGYVLLTGPIAYLVLRRMKRRELMWATAPAAALVFTLSSYAIGVGTHGSDFVDNSVELQRITPDGTLQVSSYRSLYAPQRGDHVVVLPPGTAATTAFGTYANVGFGTRNSSLDEVVVGNPPQVKLHGVNVWEANDIQTISVQPGSPVIEAQLMFSQKVLTGTIRNQSSSPLRDVRIAPAGYSTSSVLLDLLPGQTARVAVALDALTAVAPAGAISSGCIGNVNTEIGRDDCVLNAAALAGGALPGQVNIVALVNPLAPVTVDGAAPHHGAIAVLIQPVLLTSSDGLVAGLGSARLVSVYHSSPNYVDAYDLDLPSTSATTYSLRYQSAGANAYPPNVVGSSSVEVFDWSTGTWRKLPSGNQATAKLTAGETSGGLVRVRVSESFAGQYLGSISAV
jgi:hypothetical protein